MTRMYLTALKGNPVQRPWFKSALLRAGKVATASSSGFLLGKVVFWEFFLLLLLV